MSQWNNTYAYNNHYQGASTWSGDPNAQYMNQAYYANRQYDPSNQYVSFDEFLSQMQGNNVIPPNTANYNNMQYQNYPVNQYNYQNMPSTSQNTQLDTYRYGANHPNIPNGVEYSLNIQNPYNNMLPDMNSYTNEMVLKSNLTPTATEFVPKSSTIIPPTSSQNIPPTEVSSTHNDVKESRNKYSSSSETNWRERPRNIQQNGNSRHNDTKEKPEASNHLQENHRSQESIRNRESKNRNLEHRNQDTNHKSNDTNHKKYNSNSRSYDSTQNHDSNNRSQEPSSIENNRINNETNRSESINRGQSKSKSKNKDTDVPRTFYNSSIGKGSQDVRNGKGESSSKHRNWGGTQRLRAIDRNSTDDEQYANTYLQYKEEKLDKVAKTESTPSPMKSRHRNVPEQGANTEMTQRERLSEQLDKGTLECLVCCERVKQIDQVWSCGNCYHVLHLRCIRKWAVSSMLEGKWRCPACQNTNEDIPTEYRCMCGAVRSPEYQRGVNLAHTCGKACKRSRTCPHPCALLCHPGPCPPCQATISKQCGCGAETRSVLCSSKLPQVCARVCQRKLECGVHSCTKDCHEGPCDKCTEIVTQVCYCPAAKSRSVPCSAETGSYAQWSCGDSCSRILACGAHVCRRPCHPPPCPPCELLPETVITCPCGKTKLEKDKRKLCTDPIPLCENICAKPLPCGPAGDRHFCKLNCHEGPCPVCSDKTLMQCRCGHSSREVPCADLPEMINNVFCQKKCNKKLSCGRHRCRASCCASKRHRCNVTCGRMLSCQLHRCNEFCHTGHCAPCPRVSFEELPCECGAEVALPPVRCGARPPPCAAPCRRARPCGHPPHHTCHAGECPPCVVLTTKQCHGRHEERKTIPCSQEEFSCGLPCGKPLPCGKHNCIKTCHKGPCDTGKCTQPCNEKRPTCGHPCAAPCHSGAEGDAGAGAGASGASGAGAGAGAGACTGATAPCRRLVRAVCPCGRRSAERACCDNARDYAKIMSALAATKMQEGGSVDLSEVQRPGAMLKTLECDDECRVEARTRQLALALQIRNPDVSAKLAPRYGDHVRATAARDPHFAHHVHDKLTELVQLAKKSKQKTRSHSFPSMNWQKRQFIHELCEHFGCESVAYDAEPNRNVVATADREKSWLPAMSVLEVLAREAGKRRVPGPVLRAPAHAAHAAHTATTTGAHPAGATHAQHNNKSSGGWATLTSTNAWAARSQPKQQQLQPQQQQEPPATKIDYFDYPPEN